MSVRTIAIGDIHGCADALAALLQAVGPRADDCLVVLGDYVDRGPDSRSVIDQLLALRTRCRLVVLLGNHELMMLRGLNDDEDQDFWLDYGGQATLNSYGGRVAAIPAAHVEFLAGGVPFFETERYFFVHANYVPDLPLDDQPESMLLWTHLHRSRPAPHCSGKIAVVGHTPQATGEILDLGHLVCIDTCCFGGGWLTALEVDTRRIWQVDGLGRLRGQDGTEPRPALGLAHDSPVSG